jgi:hypothetical protein
MFLVNYCQGVDIPTIEKAAALIVASGYSKFVGASFDEVHAKKGVMYRNGLVIGIIGHEPVKYDKTMV